MEATVAGYANGVLKTSVGKLSSFLWGEALLVGTVRQDIQYIRDELMSMNAVLQDVISSGHFNHQLKAWMIQVLTVACDAELCTDEFKEKLDIQPGSGLAAAVLHSICSLSTRYRIAKDIQALKSRAKEVSERRSRYSIMFNIPTVLMEIKNPESTWVTSKRDTGLIQYNHLVAEGALVGIHNGDTHKICKKVATEDWLEMLVIVGPAGSGKTALARMVYRRRNYNFGRVIRTAAWVTVSDKPDMKRVLEEILRQVTKSPLQGIKEYDVKWLSDKLHEELANARYLIVLDSLWSVEDWQTLKYALPRTGKGRVVVTTRKENVAKECRRNISNRARQRYDMQTLREEQLDELIIELLSNDRLERAHSKLWGKVRKAILDICSVPLALKCLCGALAAVDMDIRWLDIMRRDLLSVYKKFPDPENRTKELLKYCWKKYLPPSLKQCSQDLSNLPEHYAINRKLLMRRWIAKGFIKPERGLSVEEVAESYFNNLISRCIIEPESVHPSGNIRRCLINGVFKEFIAPVPIPETVNPADNGQVPNSENQNPGSEQQVPNPDPAVFELSNINPSAELDLVKEHLFSRNPELLTFLDLEGCKGLRNRELDKLCKFVQLRFLILRNTDVNHLPEKIGKLKLLETLDIRQTKIKKVPHGIIGLDRLKHLLAGYIYKPERTTGANFPCSRAVEVPIQIKGMQALQTLKHVNATQASDTLHVLCELTQLKKLGLVISEKKLNSKPLCVLIMMLSASLTSLSVCDEREGGSLNFLEDMWFPPQKLESLNLRGHVGRLPQWVAKNIHLTKITLSHTQLGSDDLNLLGGIRSLLCLKLYSHSFREHELVLHKDKFNGLRVLVVCCDAIETIGFDKGAAPSLEVFKWVLFDKQITRHIDGIEKLPMLKDVSLIGSFDQKFRSSLRKNLQKNENHKKSLALHVIEKEKWENTEDETETETETINSNCNIFWR